MPGGSRAFARFAFALAMQRKILFAVEILLHNGCVQDCTMTGRTGDR
jgi:hypothetical protein